MPIIGQSKFKSFFLINTLLQQGAFATHGNTNGFDRFRPFLKSQISNMKFSFSVPPSQSKIKNQKSKIP
jgi:hypothetical protein